MSKKVILLCAGGTGGHLFPAEALAHELVSRGYVVHLAADDRVKRFSKEFPAEKIHIITSATFAGRNPVSLIKAGLKLLSGFLQSRKILRDVTPVAVAGFGGYPTLPPLMAASMSNIPTLIHDANAVLGRANRLLAKRVHRVALGFGEADTGTDKETVVTGNPVRPGILKAAKDEYPHREADQPFNLLVFGGSQGAAYFGTALPAAISLLTAEQKALLRVVQQSRREDEDSVRSRYAELGVEAIVQQFFEDMPQQISDAHFVISRAGASTVSELAVVGRPALLVPYPHALDHDQAANAALMAKAGGVKICPERNLTPEALAAHLSEAMTDPQKLALAAEAAKKTGAPTATAILADMLEALVSKTT